MSASTFPVPTVHPRLRQVAATTSPAAILHEAMRALASLKLTVALFALGLVVLAVGLAIGVLIIWAGHNSSGFQAKPPFSWDMFWRICLAVSVVLWCVAAVAYGAYWGRILRGGPIAIALVQIYLAIKI